ncbi:GPI mannosyltransferase 4-like [Callorhinchus milii]|uniref:Mannosyltransferase n=1 Tax=Callorhinchus milii TaxID=7868 RepID=A0A4W3HQJ3_CALMI|nr:GPI mannosyltransferase 4-like [Callorhinchus milii]|eukprot:gi/632934031/ref/XP_007896992.1/ PREDICTED: GPI mannosyltransferase 4-like [Callorhinchus milii]
MALKIVWLTLGVVRLLWCLNPQTGYIHPDEFFQSPEVMAGDILNLKILRPWEFNTSYPSRSVLFPLVTSGLSFTVLKTLHNSNLFGSIVNSYSLLVVPRFFMTCLSFLIDYVIYRLSRLWGANPWNALVLLSSSHVMLVFYTRTFSNVIEGALFALLLLLVAMDVKPATVTQHHRAQKKRNHKHLIGIVLVSGFFNRPTFIGFALVPMLTWLFRDQGGKIQFSLKTIMLNSFGILSPVIATSFIFIVTDSVYFSSLLSLIDKKAVNITPYLVLSPINFIVYNFQPKNLIAHGSHPWFTHLTVNSLMLFGVLHFSAIVTGIQMVTGKFAHKAGSQKQQWESKLAAQSPALSPITGYIMLVYFVPLIILSLFSHQEARFIIPLIVPLVILTAPKYELVRWKVVVVMFNVFGSVLFGCLHQGGLIPCLSYLEKTLHSNTPIVDQHKHNLVFYHTYMPPRYLLNIRKDQDSVRIIDLGGAEVSVLHKTVSELLDDLSSKHIGSDQDMNIYIVAPGTVQEVVKNSGLSLQTTASFFPHLSMEDPPDLPSLLSKDGLDQLNLYVFKVMQGLKS